MRPTTATANHLDAICTTLINEYGKNAVPWLNLRWDSLNERRPIVQFTYMLDAETSMRQRISMEADLSLIAQVVDEERWGGIDYRKDAFPRIMNGLLDGFEQGSYDEWFQKMDGPKMNGIEDRIGLVEIPGIYGPLYRVNKGRHRIHTLMALDLGTFPVDVTRMEQSRIIDFTHHRGKRRQDIPPLLMRLIDPDIPSEMATALVNTGHLEQLEINRYRVLQELPGPWLFSDTWKKVELASRRYRLSYPQYGATPLEEMSLCADQAKRFVRKHGKVRRNACRP